MIGQPKGLVIEYQSNGSSPSIGSQVCHIQLLQKQQPILMIVFLQASQRNSEAGKYSYTRLLLRFRRPAETFIPPVPSLLVKINDTDQYQYAPPLLDGESNSSDYTFSVNSSTGSGYVAGLAPLEGDPPVDIDKQIGGVTQEYEIIKETQI